MNEDEKYWVCKAMRVYGGSFVQKLGEALMFADSVNSEKVKKTWPEYWSEYLEMGRELKLESEEK